MLNTNGLQYLSLCLSASFHVLSPSLFTNYRIAVCCIARVSQRRKIVNKWNRRWQRFVISVEKAPVCLSGLSGMPTIIVKLSQAVIVVSANCSDFKICEFFHAVCLCISSILTLNSEYLRDRNNRAVFVMGTENKMLNTCSVSRANKRHFLCTIDTALILLGLPVYWSDATRLLRVMLVRDRHAAIGDICQRVVCRSHCRQSGPLMCHTEYLRGAQFDGQTSSLCWPISTTWSILRVDCSCFRAFNCISGLKLLNVSWSCNLFLIQRRIKEAPHTFPEALLLRQLSDRCRYLSVQE
jgi:hypothetical protein